MECYKKTFYSKEEAIARMQEIQKEATKVKRPVRAYRCKRCKKWHLTSITKKDFKLMKINMPQNKQERFLLREAKFWADKNGWDYFD